MKIVLTLRVMPAVFAAIAMLGLWSATPAAADNNPGQFIQDMAGRAIAALKETGKDDLKAREQKFRVIFQQGFDIPAIGRFVLGQYWRRASEQQRAEYLKLFEDFVVHSYAQRLNQYSGETFQVGRTLPKDDHYEVESQIIKTDGSQPLNIVWEVEKANSFKVVDVKIEGVSMGLTQRSDFSSFLGQNGGNVEALIDKLKQMTAGK